MSYDNEATRLRKLSRNPNVLFWWTDHAEKERQKDSIAKIDVHNMLKRCSVSNVEDTDGEEGWRAEGTDIDARRIAAIVVAYEDAASPEIKIVTTWAKK
jgi:hypothetical protein